MRDEIHLQSSVCVSMARVLDEPADLRQLVQASSGAALDLCGPRICGGLTGVCLTGLVTLL
jgi:hypothetical protein